MNHGLAVAFCAAMPIALLAHPADAKARKHHHHRMASHRHDIQAHRSDLINVLASKVGEIQSACGSHLISAYRPGARIAGTGHPSLHSLYPARAADLSGNPSCIYAHLRGWQGGYSIDYGRVRHVHVSWSPPGSGHLAGKEWHARFVHGGGSHHYARRHNSRDLLGRIDYQPQRLARRRADMRVANRAHNYAVDCGLMTDCR